MSTQQPNSACLVSVDPSTADILRRQTLIILEANHYYFEDILEFGPEAQHALSVIYRVAFAVLDTIGWRRPEPPPATVDVPFTAGFVERLRERRYDLGHTNIDRLDMKDMATSSDTAHELDAEIAAALVAIRNLDSALALYTRALGGDPTRA